MGARNRTMVSELSHCYSSLTPCRWIAQYYPDIGTNTFNFTWFDKSELYYFNDKNLETIYFQSYYNNDIGQSNQRFHLGLRNNKMDIYIILIQGLRSHIFSNISHPMVSVILASVTKIVEYKIPNKFSLKNFVYTFFR